MISISNFYLIFAKYKFEIFILDKMVNSKYFEFDEYAYSFRSDTWDLSEIIDKIGIDIVFVGNQKIELNRTWNCFTDHDYIGLRIIFFESVDRMIDRLMAN